MDLKGRVRLLFDTEKFINEVRGQPVLWDKRMAQYNEKETRDTCWTEIGQQMFGDWDDSTNKTRNERVLQMKQRWRHLRDHFLRMSKYPERKPKKGYCYAKSMSFLSEVMGINYQQILALQRSQKSEEVNPVEDLAEVNVDEETAEEMTVEIIKPRTLRSVRKGVKRSPESPTTETETPEPPRKHTKSTVDHRVSEPRNEEDVDRMFLLSMLKDFKSLTENEKLDYKIMNLQFFKNVRQRRDLMNMGMPLNIQGGSSNQRSNLNQVRNNIDGEGGDQNATSLQDG